MIRGVLLDFYGTVAEEDDAVIAQIVDRVRRDVGVVDAGAVMADEGWRLFSRLCAEAHGGAFRSQRALERDSLASALALAGSSIDPFELSEGFFHHWQRPTILPDGERFIRSSELPICIVSNIDRTDLEAALSHHHIEAQFVVTSEVARAYKPRPKMFALTLDVLDMAAGDVVHIGDSISRDVAGSQCAGIRSVWINRSRKSTPGMLPTAVAADLDEAQQFITAANAVTR